MWKHIFLQTFNIFDARTFRFLMCIGTGLLVLRVLIVVNYQQTSFKQLAYFVINVSAMAYQDERKIKKCEAKNEFIKMCLLVRSINKKILYEVLANFKAYLFTYSTQVFIEVEFFIYLKDALSNLRQFLPTECP